MIPVIPGLNPLIRIILILLDVLNCMRQNNTILNTLMGLPPITVIIQNLGVLYDAAESIELRKQRGSRNKPHKLLKLLRGYRYILFMILYTVRNFFKVD